LVGGVNGIFTGPVAGLPCLEAEVDLVNHAIEAGSLGRGQLHLKNAGPELVEIKTDQPLVAEILDSSTMERVGGRPGIFLGARLRIRLNTGEKESVPFFFETSTLKDGESVAFPPGKYLVNVDLPLYESRFDREGSKRSYLTMPLTSIQLQGGHPSER
jgi:hypothetical protein